MKNDDIKQNKKASFMRSIVEASRDTSLGISIVVAIILGVLIGLGLKALTGLTWTLFIGVFIGICAAILNVYKAYKQLVKMYEE